PKRGQSCGKRAAKREIIIAIKFSTAAGSCKAGGTWAARMVSDHGASIGVRFPDRPQKFKR
ncbi:hypothetical protein, partial [uncultured Muribaculum sp.]|uniref:hypothetical protein n=1 Tax=uncultured Muribaculum sp. TaxID=1918613 RepID=UPI0025B6483A